MSAKGTRPSKEKENTQTKNRKAPGPDRAGTNAPSATLNRQPCATAHSAKHSQRARQAKKFKEKRNREDSEEERIPLGASALKESEGKAEGRGKVNKEATKWVKCNQ